MSQGLTQTWQKGADWFNERPIRERALITATCLVLLLFAGWELAVTPVVGTNERLESRLKTLAQQQQALVEQQQTLTERLSSDPSLELRQRLEARRAKLERLDAELAETTGKLIAPRAMVTLLRDILVAQDELELVAMELLAPTPIFDEQDEKQESGTPDSEAARAPLLYAHDVEIVIRGGYLDVLDYIETLETMDDRLGWVSLNYQMLEYPRNEVRIRVRTLSLERAWLGV